MKQKNRARYGLARTDAVEPVGLAAVVASTTRELPTGQEWRVRCHATVERLEEAAYDAQVSVLTDGMGHPPTLLEAVERSERYRAAAAVVRRWSGQPG